MLGSVIVSFIYVKHAQKKNYRHRGQRLSLLPITSSGFESQCCCLLGGRGAVANLQSPVPTENKGCPGTTVGEYVGEAHWERAGGCW